ncbi:MAG: Ig-like domain-containing protein [Holophaga sp.]|nr:Ig-like domain-containing protein [Holophaga sp.]
MLLLPLGWVGCSGGGGTAPVQTPRAATTLVSIDVTPAQPSIAKGTTQQFTAMGVFSNATTQDLTSSVTWTAEDASGAVTISGTSGLVTAVAAGSATIKATYGGSLSGTASLTVTTATLVSISVTRAQPSIAQGTTQQFTATGVFSNATTQDLTSSASWTTDNGAAATISSIPGLVNGVAAGSATIKATYGGLSGTASLAVTTATLVSVGVTPAQPSIGQATTQQFTATGVFSNATTQDLTSSASWTTDTSAAAISSTPGLVTGVAAGSATIKATYDGLSGSAFLTVTAAKLMSIDVTPAQPSIAKTTTQPFYATGILSDYTTQDLTTSVRWTSSDTTIATISNPSGSIWLATGAGVGTAAIKATYGGLSGSTDLTVTPATLVSIAVTPANSTISRVDGSSIQFRATGTFADQTTQDITDSVTWSSDFTGINWIPGAHGEATLSNGGSAPVPITITATSSDGRISGSTSLTVV